MVIIVLSIHILFWLLLSIVFSKSRQGGDFSSPYILSDF